MSDKQIERMRDRIERLRGLCKTAVGYLRDEDAYMEANEIAALIGDMEPPLASSPAAPEQAAGEPVAWWRYEGEHTDRFEKGWFQREKPERNGIPLYTHSAPASPPTKQAGTEWDWPEDFSHENGNYENICIYCTVHFQGHKRRVVCRKCALSRPSAEAQGSGEPCEYAVNSSSGPWCSGSMASQKDAGGIGKDILDLIAKHRGHVEQSPGGGYEVQKYALACYDDLENDIKAALSTIGGKGGAG